MKKNKLKIITIILLIVLVTMVGVIGIYTKEKGQMINKVKDYEYGMNVQGKRVATLELSTEELEVVKDSKGNVVEGATDEEIKKNGYKTEKTPVNSQDSLTSENYSVTKEILEKRLNQLNASNYEIKLDEKTGKIMVELPEDDNTDNLVSNLTTVGKFEIIDTDTKEVLLNNNDIKTSEALRSTTTTGTSIYLSIEFNNEGKKKLEDITKKYVKVDQETSENETTETSESENTTSENKTTENTTTENTASEDTATEENTEKTITMKLDDTEIMSTSFEEPITDGKMYLTVGQETTNIDTLNENLKQARNMVAVIANQNLPLTYELNSNIYIESPVKDIITFGILIAIGCIVAVTLIVFLIRYRGKGLLAGISYIGLSALLLLIVRYWNVELSIEGIVSLFAMLILNYILTNKILKNIKKEKDNPKADLKHIINMSIKDFTLKVIPLFIIAIVFAFMQWSSTSSFGMVMFWGLTLIELYNLLITKNLLKYKKM